MSVNDESDIYRVIYRAPLRQAETQKCAEMEIEQLVGCRCSLTVLLELPIFVIYYLGN